MMLRGHALAMHALLAWVLIVAVANGVENEGEMRREGDMESEIETESERGRGREHT